MTNKVKRLTREWINDYSNQLLDAEFETPEEQLEMDTIVINEKKSILKAIKECDCDKLKTPIKFPKGKGILDYPNLREELREDILDRYFNEFYMSQKIINEHINNSKP